MEKVSIIIPYNQDRGYLNEAIASVERQSYKNIELILSKSPGGVSFNINRGIEKATGRYIKYLCDDDRLTQCSIELSVQAMNGYDFIHGNAINFYPNGQVEYHRPMVRRPTLKQLLVHNHIHGGTLMYDRSVFERFGKFCEALWTGEEYEFNLRLLDKGARIGYCNADLYEYRRHTGKKSIGNMESDYQKQRREAINDIKSIYQ